MVHVPNHLGEKRSLHLLPRLYDQRRQLADARGIVDRRHLYPYGSGVGQAEAIAHRKQDHLFPAPIGRGHEAESVGQWFDADLHLLLPRGKPGELIGRIRRIGHQKIVQVEGFVAAVLQHDDIGQAEQPALQAGRPDHLHIYCVRILQAIRTPGGEGQRLRPGPVVRRLYRHSSLRFDLRPNSIPPAHLPFDLGVRIDSVDDVFVEPNRPVPSPARHHQIRNICNEQTGPDQHVQPSDQGRFEVPFLQLPLVVDHLVRGETEWEAKIHGDIRLRSQPDRLDLERGDHPGAAGSGVSQICHPVDQLSLIGQQTVQGLAWLWHVFFC